MSEAAVVAVPTPAVPKTSKAKAPKAAKKPAKPAAHPSFSMMVAVAIGALKERNGSSRQAIAKDVTATYKVDAKTAGPHLRKVLKKGVESGALKQVKGSFKLDKPEKEAKKTSPKKPAAAKKSATKKSSAAAKKPAAKKATKKPSQATKKKPSRQEARNEESS